MLGSALSVFSVNHPELLLEQFHLYLKDFPAQMVAWVSQMGQPVK